MTVTTSHRLPWTDRYRVVLLTGTSLQKLTAMLLASLSGFVMMLPVLLLVPMQSNGSRLFVALFALAGLIIVLLVLSPLILRANKKQLLAFNERLGIQASRKDLLALCMWMRYGVVPKQQRLRVVLPRYLAYVEATARGQANGVSVKKWSQLFYLYLVCIGLFTLSLGFSIFAHTPINWFNVILIVISSVNAVNFYYMKQGQISPLFSVFNRKHLRRVEQRRQELSKTQVTAS